MHSAVLSLGLAELGAFDPNLKVIEYRYAGGPSGLVAMTVRDFADEHGLTMISIADLIAHVRRTERQVERVATTQLPTRFGDFTAFGYRDAITGTDHVDGDGGHG